MCGAEISAVQLWKVNDNHFGSEYTSPGHLCPKFFIWHWKGIGYARFVPVDKSTLNVVCMSDGLREKGAGEKKRRRPSET